jgi:hypothetical protein
LETFEKHHANVNGGKTDGPITQDEFIDFYHNVSAHIEDDDEFFAIVAGEWHLNHAKKQV